MVPGEMFSPTEFQFKPIRAERIVKVMAKSNASVDTHALSVVSNRTYEITRSGNTSERETWIKAAINGGEGTVAQKFALLANSPLQFKISTSARIQDAKATDVYYPHGKECAQLFAVMSDLTMYVDMEGFEAAKWEKRFSSGMLAQERLAEYVSYVESQEKKKIVPPTVKAKGKGKAKEADPVADVVDTNRITEESIPVVPATV